MVCRADSTSAHLVPEPFDSCTKGFNRHLVETSQKRDSRAQCGRASESFDQHNFTACSHRLVHIADCGQPRGIRLAAGWLKSAVRRGYINGRDVLLVFVKIRITQGHAIF